MRAKGVGTTVLEYASDHVEVLRKLGLKVFYGDATREDLLAKAGADEAEVLVVAIEDPGKVLTVVETAQRYFPHLKILARSTGRRQAYELLEKGVHHVYRETLDTSLRMGIDVLRELGYRGYQAFRAARLFRHHDEESVRELYRFRHDRQSYLSLARQRIEDLESVMLGELVAKQEDRDAGWDTESLREEYAPAES